MISDSFTLKDPDQDLYPLISLHGDPLLFAGGNANPKLAGPSPSDIERVAALYPSEFQATDLGQTPSPPLGKRSVAANNTRSLQSCSRVEIPGVAVTTAGPVPTKQTTGVRPTSRATKRWYSVPLEQEAAPESQRPWPACDDGTSTISYCFEDAASHKILEELFVKALAKWAPAMHASSLVFAPDAVCTGDLHSRCLCNTPGMAKTTLHIMFTKDGDPKLRLAISHLQCRTTILVNPGIISCGLRIRIYLGLKHL